MWYLSLLTCSKYENVVERRPAGSLVPTQTTAALSQLIANVPVFRMQHDGSGVFKAEGVVGVDAVLGQLLHEPPVQLGHLETIQEAVHPVELPGHPVDGEALAVQNSVHHHLPVGAVEEHPLHHPAVHVDPIQAPFHAVKVHGHHAGQALQDERVGVAVRRQVSQVVAVAEDEVRRDVAVLTTAAAVGLPQVPRGALADVRAHGVLADLAAHGGRLGALVQVVAGLAVGHEPVPGAAGADEAGGRVGAVVVTVVDGWVGAFVDA